ncbi:hypothetical protein HHI36_017528 [Cryptolaemus montrouzieri]|uniref:Uncharacterized protein n=1 Tax=Cryptolaemus montrouzieri TaxID=559131 RepID=A0ABD2NN48_9CUCU
MQIQRERKEIVNECDVPKSAKSIQLNMGNKKSIDTNNRKGDSVLKRTKRLGTGQSEVGSSFSEVESRFWLYLIRVDSRATRTILSIT